MRHEIEKPRIADSQISRVFRSIPLKGAGEVIQLSLEVQPEGFFHIEDEKYGISIRGGMDLERREVGLRHLVIGEGLRGQGLGLKIMDEVEDCFKSRGIKNIYAAFRQDGTLRFLMKRGYRIEDPKKLSQEARLALDLFGIQFEDRIDTDSFRRWKIKDSGLDTGGKLLLKKEIAI